MLKRPLAWLSRRLTPGATTRYGSRTEADILLRAELDALAAQHPARFQVVYFVEHAKAPAAPAVEASGPAWTRGELEAPAGEKDLGTSVQAVYTAEQQARLGVDENGAKAEAATAAADASPADAAEDQRRSLQLQEQEQEVEGDGNEDEPPRPNFGAMMQQRRETLAHKRGDRAPALGLAPLARKIATHARTQYARMHVRMRACARRPRSLARTRWRLPRGVTTGRCTTGRESRVARVPATPAASSGTNICRYLSLTLTARVVRMPCAEAPMDRQHGHDGMVHGHTVGTLYSAKEVCLRKKQNKTSQHLKQRVRFARDPRPVCCIFKSPLAGSRPCSAI